MGNALGSLGFPAGHSQARPGDAKPPQAHLDKVGQVLILDGTVGPKAQVETIKIKKNGEVYAKATFEEGKAGEAELDGHHGILLDMHPRHHVAFLDTAEIRD